VTFEYEMEINASPDEVWHALRDREQLRRWHGWHTDGLDEEIDVIYFSDEVREDGHTLSMGGDVFAVTSRGGRTILKLTRAPKGSNPEWDDYYDDITEGWTTFMQQLRFALERHPGVDRQTLHLSSDADDKRATSLTSVVSGQPGSRYAFTTPGGEVLSGEVWFRSPHQVGLTVDGWGDGLLVAGEVPPSLAHPLGASQMVLTGYNDTFPVSAKAWQSWWTEQDA